VNKSKSKSTLVICIAPHNGEAPLLRRSGMGRV